MEAHIRSRELHRIYQNFIERLTGNSDVAGLQTALSETASAFDLRTFAYLLMPSQALAETTLISNYPSAWITHYLSNHYEKLDPVVGQAAQSQIPFEWGPDLRLVQPVGFHERFFDEAAEFGIRYGFTIPIHDKANRIAAVTFATDERHAPFCRCIDVHRSVLHLMALFFHRYACRVLAADRNVDGVVLSRREFQCLEWAAKGKSAWEIGQILGISRRTAAFHLDNAKAKLGVRSVSQAVARLAASMPTAY